MTEIEVSADGTDTRTYASVVTRPPIVPAGPRTQPVALFADESRDPAGTVALFDLMTGEPTV